MKTEDFGTKSPGRLVKIPQETWAFIPNPLPPNFDIDLKTMNLLSKADHSLGELNGIGKRLPNPHLLIGPFLTREAILSNRIEGTIASVEQLLIFEADPLEGQEDSDVSEIKNYIVAMEYGLERQKSLPMSLRFIRELHQKLLDGVRGRNRRPGDFRKNQNAIGQMGRPLTEARFVPPPVPQMLTALNDFEKFLVSDWNLPPVIALALIHYQFETIHPFMDGNGRLGRLLITLLLCEKKLLSQPLLYLSAFFERNRNEYADKMLKVSQSGNWIDWVRFFASGVVDQSEDAVFRSNQLSVLQESYHKRVHSKRTSSLVLQSADELFRSPWTNMKRTVSKLKVTNRSAQQLINKLVDVEILKETTGQKRNRIYIAPEIIKIIEQDEPSFK